MDKSNGYEEKAAIFIKMRGEKMDGIGASVVRNWAKTLPSNATVLDLGCGNGVPISKLLMDEGLMVYGLDASPLMVQNFQRNFPDTPVACEAVEESSFFDRQFDAIIAWGLLFLLSPEAQEIVIQKAASALKFGGKLLFTAPYQEISWKDVLTDQESTSLGAEKYKELLSASGLSLIEEFTDEGDNYYYHAIKG